MIAQFDAGQVGTERMEFRIFQIVCSQIVNTILGQKVLFPSWISMKKRMTH